MFIDTSAVVAILSKEEDAASLADRIEAAPLRMTSALVVLESVMRLSTKLAREPIAVHGEVLNFLTEASAHLVPIEATAMNIAVQAFSDYGKGRGHPAQLNLADCLSYACAKEHGVPLLYKGNDFARTDMA